MDFYTVVDQLRKRYNTPAGEQPLATCARALIDQNGVVQFSADDPSLNSKNIVSKYVSLNGDTVNWNTKGQNETLYIAPAGTIAGLTVVIPLDAQSVIGQIIKLFSTQTVTTLTVTANGNTLNGVAVTTLGAGVNGVSWQKIDSNRWVRLS